MFLTVELSDYECRLALVAAIYAKAVDAVRAPARYAVVVSDRESADRFHIQFRPLTEHECRVIDDYEAPWFYSPGGGVWLRLDGFQGAREWDPEGEPEIVKLTPGPGETEADGVTF